MLALLLGTGVFLTIQFRFVQVARVREVPRAMEPTRTTGTDTRSHFQAFMTALGS